MTKSELLVRFFILKINNLSANRTKDLYHIVHIAVNSKTSNSNQKTTQP